MVQFFQTSPSLSSRMAKSFFDPVLQSMEEETARKYQQKSLKQQRDLQLEQGKILSGAFQKAQSGEPLTAEDLEGLTPETLKHLEPLLREKAKGREKINLYEKFLESQNNATQQNQETQQSQLKNNQVQEEPFKVPFKMKEPMAQNQMNTAPQLLEEGTRSFKLEHEKPIPSPIPHTSQNIQRMAFINPEIARQMREENKAAIQQNQFDEKNYRNLVESRKKETSKMRSDLANKANYARQGIENKKGLLSLVKKGNLDDPYVATIARMLPGSLGDRLLSPDSQIYRAGLFDEFGVLRQMFPGATRTKEIELLEDKIATLDKSHEAKEKLLNVGMMKLERDVILGKTAAHLEKEYPTASILEFEELLAEKSKPELDNLYNKIIEEYDRVYFKYAPEKSNFTDQNGNRYSNIPKSKLEEFFNQAKGKGIELKAN